MGVARQGVLPAGRRGLRACGACRIHTFWSSRQRSNSASLHLQDAERRAQAAEEAAEAAGTAATRLAGRRQVAAEGRAADKEAEAKSASLRALVSGLQG